MTVSDHPLGHRVGGWLPRNHETIQTHLNGLIDHVEKHPKPLHPVIQEFKDLIEKDTTVYMLFHQMFEQVPYKPPYHQDPSGHPEVRSYMRMLKLFNHILTTPPEFNPSGHVFLSFSAILDWPKGTEGGFVAFLNDKVNAQFQKVLDAWGQFLLTPASAATLTTADNGWFSKMAMQEIPNFEASYVCDPSKPHYGFTCWDDFFTRLFKPGVRPVEFPDNDQIINCACESAPYKISTNVKARDRFWIKEQMYSLDDMLADPKFASQFVGGTVYQAFLSALSYHRWHSPINGTVKKTYKIPGTYFSETPVYGFNSKDGPQPNGLTDSQAYITAMATRAVIVFEADNPAIGTMCFIGIGMGEVSTCEITVTEGQRVKKGDQLGMFHFGGSTHCLIFRPGINIKWDLQGQQPSLDATNLKLNTAIGFVEN